MAIYWDSTKSEKEKISLLKSHYFSEIHGDLQIPDSIVNNENISVKFWYYLYKFKVDNLDIPFDQFNIGTTEFIFLKGIFFRYRGNFELAIIWFEKLHKTIHELLILDSKLYREYYRLLGESYYYQQLWADAIENFDKYLQVSEDDVFRHGITINLLNACLHHGDILRCKELLDLIEFDDNRERQYFMKKLTKLSST